MDYGTGFRQRDFKVGDMILYPYVEDEVLRGRVVKLMDEQCEIEISFHGKKSEELNCNTIRVLYSESRRMSKGIKCFKTKEQKKERKARKKKESSQEKED